MFVAADFETEFACGPSWLSTPQVGKDDPELFLLSPP